MSTKPGAALRLSPLTPEHARRVWGWKNNPEVSHHLPEESVSKDQIEAYAEAHSEDDAVRHLLIVAPRDQVVGYLVVAVHDDAERSFRWGSFEILIGPEHQGRGHGRQALHLVPSYLADWRGVEVLMFGVYADNDRALSLYASLGYHEVEHQWLWRGSTRRRTVLMSNRPDLFKRRPIGFSD